MRFDAIVVGAGAGGGIAACVLAEAGKTVLLLERGKWLAFADVPRDHLRNHRLAQYGHNTGPDIEGNPRVNNNHIFKPHQGGYNNIASCVGSGTLVYGAQAWRFHPLDFRMASTYGAPEGSSLADWPIDYEELAPYYERAEWEMGVNGSAPAPQMPPRRDYPMPPLHRGPKGKRLEEGAKRLGWATQHPPMMINSTSYNGRPGCIQCQHCVGFACPSDSKNGTQNTVIPRAIATGRCTVETDGGRVTGVMYRNWKGELQTAHADVVVVSCSAIETARLLINSGVGNDNVGRNLQGHYYATAAGVMPEKIWDGVGPGASISTLEFNHGNDGIVGGGMLSDDFITMPIVYAKWFRPPGMPAWGQAHKDWMRETYTKFVQVLGPVHEIPMASCRVQVANEVRDKWGVPVASLSGTTHPETVKTTRFMIQRAREWLTAAGAETVYSGEPGLGLSGGQHQAGTCRMGFDPKTSVVDEWCRVHGHDNLYIADGSVHVTNGGFNPMLTIMALSYRTSTGISRAW